MKGQKKLEWIEEGYRVVAEEGFNNLNIESIARSIDKNKSSFYHYFGDLDWFKSELLSYHLDRAKEFAEAINACKDIRPGIIEVFVAYKTDLFFHKRLRIHRSNPEYKKCFEKVYEMYESAVLVKWAHFLGLDNQPHLASNFLNLMAENFLLQITQDSYSAAWLDSYLQNASAILRQMNAGSGK